VLRNGYILSLLFPVREERSRSDSDCPRIVLVPSGRRFIVVELELGGKGTPIVAEQDQRPKKWANPYLNRIDPHACERQGWSESIFGVRRTEKLHPTTRQRGSPRRLAGIWLSHHLIMRLGTV